MIAALSLCLLVANDLAQAFERLSAPLAEERAAAQRDLTRLLGPDDLHALRAHASAAGAEVRRRLVFALADSDRHLGLAAALACDAEGRLAAVGRDALAEMIARWSPGYAQIGLARSDTIEKLREREDPALRLDPRLMADPEAALDALARELPGVPPIALDPEVSASERGGAAFELVEGPTDLVLAEILRAHTLGLESFGIDDDDGELADHVGRVGRPRPWIRITRGGGEAQRTGTECLIDWCAGTVCASEPRRRNACARALAASGWPAAVAWLESRWLAGRDEAALEGLLLAAGRGRVARIFARVEVQRDLHARMRAAAAEGTRASDRRAERIARALGAAGTAGIGDAVGIGGTGGSGTGAVDLGAIALEGWSGFSARELWLALVVLEGQGRAPQDALAKIGALLGDLARERARLAPAIVALDPRHPSAAALRLQALRVLSLAGPISSARAELGGNAARAWLANAEHSAALDETVQRLVDLAIAPPEGLVPAPDDGTMSAAQRRAALEWIVFAAPPETGARLVLDVLGGPADARGEIEALAARFLPRVRARQSRQLEAVLQRAREVASKSASPTAVDMLELLAVLSGIQDQGPAAISAALSAERHDRPSLLVLGAIAAGERGAAARERLVHALAGPIKLEDSAELEDSADLEDLIAALDRAVFELRAARAETEELGFIKAVRDAARGGDPSRRARLRVDVWPSAPGSEPIDLGALERSFDRARL